MPAMSSPRENGADDQRGQALSPEHKVLWLRVLAEETCNDSSSPLRRQFRAGATCRRALPTPRGSAVPLVIRIRHHLSAHASERQEAGESRGTGGQQSPTQREGPGCHQLRRPQASLGAPVAKCTHRRVHAPTCSFSIAAACLRCSSSSASSLRFRFSSSRKAFSSSPARGTLIGTFNHGR